LETAPIATFFITTDTHVGPEQIAGMDKAYLAKPLEIKVAVGKFPRIVMFIAKLTIGMEARVRSLIIALNFCKLEQRVCFF
jgi:hypothetical protein